MELRVTMNQVRAATAPIHDAKVEASKDRPRATYKDHRTRLAVVGGGVSVLEHIDELRAWDGEIWAINYTGKWLGEHGIASKLFTVDSSIHIIERWPLCIGAVLASCVDPEIFDAFPESECFDLLEDVTELDGVPGGSTSLCRMPILAMSMGYLDIHLFGCEGSFPEGQTHVDRNEELFKHHMSVKAGEQTYLTRDDLYIQCAYMAETFRDIPYIIKNRSGGLLQGMIDNPTGYSVCGVSDEMEAEIWAEYSKQVGYEQRQEVSIAGYPTGNNRYTMPLQQSIIGA